MTLCVIGLIALTLVFPRAVLAVMMGWAAVTLVVSGVFKLLAFVARMSEGPVAPVVPVAEDKTPLPRVSVPCRSSAKPRWRMRWWRG